MSFRYTAQATSSATGAVTLNFPSPSPQQSWVATLSVPASGPGVMWTVLVNNIAVATVQGSSGYGPYSFTSGESIQMVSSNAMPNLLYQGVITGAFSNASTAPPQQLTAVSTVLPEVPITTITANGTYTIGIQPYYRTILLIPSPNVPQAATWEIVGNVTGYVYGPGTFASTLGVSNEVQYVDIKTAAFDTELAITIGGLSAGETVWVAADESELVQDISITGDNQVSEQVDFYEYTTNLTTTFSSESLIAQSSYPGIGVSIDAGIGVPVAVYIEDSNGNVSGVQTAQVGPTGECVPLIFPMAIAFNTAFYVYARTISGSGSAEVEVWGYSGALPTQTPLRGDGRLYPLGTHLVTGAANNNTTTLVAAPGAGLSLLIYSAEVISLGVTEGIMNVTIRGVTTGLVYTPNVASSSSSVWPQGILCDTNTAITLTSSAAVVVVGSVTVDVVA
jgi:hypothetical protein